MAFTLQLPTINPNSEQQQLFTFIEPPFEIFTHLVDLHNQPQQQVFTSLRPKLRRRELIERGLAIRPKAEYWSSCFTFPSFYLSVCYNRDSPQFVHDLMIKKGTTLYFLKAYDSFLISFPSFWSPWPPSQKNTLYFPRGCLHCNLAQVSSVLNFPSMELHSCAISFSLSLSFCSPRTLRQFSFHFLRNAQR